MTWQEFKEKVDTRLDKEGILPSEIEIVMIDINDEELQKRGINIRLKHGLIVV